MFSASTQLRSARVRTWWGINPEMSSIGVSPGIGWGSFIARAAVRQHVFSTAPATRRVELDLREPWCLEASVRGIRRDAQHAAAGRLYAVAVEEFASVQA